MPRCAAVVPAAGSSKRMSGEDKIFMELGGVPVLYRTVALLAQCEYIAEIVVAVRDDSVQKAAELLKDIDKVTFVLAGGEERLDSVAAAVGSVSKRAKYIIVHDGARPLVTKDIIDATVAAAKTYGASACAVPVKDTVKIAERGVVKSTPDRSSLFAVQTPQVFDADLLRCALKNAQDNGLAVTDDCMAVEALGGTVLLSEGSYENIKLTTPSDIPAAEAILKGREQCG
ncbi:MAG: 2-C-methyl-D-erythritol 4-phosphate cytidylyltransferase [Oscillospiraceae bacterium]|nr:2-C-methyl-D-erythritol 4-phosphate cytidylyltransferase [Oscillospiraceae bacterium]